MLKKFVMLFVLADNWLTNLVKRLFSTCWQLTGHCRQCGQCCRRIILTMTPAQIKSKLFTDLSIRWISWLFGFRLIEIDHEHYSLVFNCRHQTPEGKCGNYRWRPNVCRNYPLVDYFKEPQLLPGCGFAKNISGETV
jgi:Fe-S-cluster containining protein